MRLWHQSLAPIGSFGSYPELLRNHIAGVVSVGTEVDLHGIDDDAYLGMSPAQLLGSPYARHLIQQRVPEICRRAERQGYDAVVFASFSEPLLAECRSAVDIPVVSMAEVSLHLACQLADQVALISLGPAGARRIRTLVARHGLQSRVSGVYGLDPAATERELLDQLDDPRPRVVANFLGVAEHAMAQGADVIVPAEGVLCELLQAHEARTVGAAVVLDAVAAAFAHAEMLVSVRTRTGLRTPRAWSYPQTSDENGEQLRRKAGVEST